MNQPATPFSNRICACGCNEVFLPNRIDQVYLNNKHYNSYYNNYVRKKNDKSIKAVNKILYKNRTILVSLMNKAETSLTFTRELLSSLGFNFKHVTSVVNLENLEFSIYDFHLRLITDKSLVIVTPSYNSHSLKRIKRSRF